MYFISISKVDEIYCNYLKKLKRLKQNKDMGKYRRTYQQKFMQVRKDKKLVRDFEI